MTMAQLTGITTLQQYHEMLATHDNVVILASNSSCPMCVYMKPIWKEVATSRKFPSLSFGEMDVSGVMVRAYRSWPIEPENFVGGTHIAHRFFVPLFVIFRRGEPFVMAGGAMEKIAFEEWLAKYLHVVNQLSEFGEKWMSREIREIKTAPELDEIISRDEHVLLIIRALWCAQSVGMTKTIERLATSEKFKALGLYYAASEVLNTDDDEGCDFVSSQVVEQLKSTDGYLEMECPYFAIFFRGKLFFQSPATEKTVIEKLLSDYLHASSIASSAYSSGSFSLGNGALESITEKVRLDQVLVSSDNVVVYAYSPRSLNARSMLDVAYRASRSNEFKNVHFYRVNQEANPDVLADKGTENSHEFLIYHRGSLVVRDNKLMTWEELKTWLIGHLFVPKFTFRSSASSLDNTPLRLTRRASFSSPSGTPSIPVVYGESGKRIRHSKSLDGGSSELGGGAVPGTQTDTSTPTQPAATVARYAGIGSSSSFASTRTVGMALCKGTFPHQKKSWWRYESRKFHDQEPGCYWTPTEDGDDLVIAEGREGESVFSIAAGAVDGGGADKLFFRVHFLPYRCRWTSALITMKFLDEDHRPIKIRHVTPEDLKQAGGVIERQTQTNGSLNISAGGGSIPATVGAQAGMTVTDKATIETGIRIRGYGQSLDEARWTLEEDKWSAGKEGLTGPYTLEVQLATPQDFVRIQGHAKATCHIPRPLPREHTIQLGTSKEPISRVVVCRSEKLERAMMDKPI